MEQFKVILVSLLHVAAGHEGGIKGGETFLSACPTDPETGDRPYSVNTRLTAYTVRLAAWNIGQRRSGEVKKRA